MSYNILVMFGADIALDKRILTGYFASRQCSLSTRISANYIAKAKNFVSEAVASLASAIQSPVLATARV